MVGGAGSRRARTIDELLQAHPELEEVLLDIPRPKNKKKRKSHHSGKKQTMTQVLTDLMLHVSSPMVGRRHDSRKALYQGS